ncbi:MAG: glycerol-3-phosphate 1-O-acyltransferase PlsY [Planctomycetes bacterium]|nr:glycerol-3-phosphate 1-O-acyltransferase PlsY [Planctomycetota bacterium]
MPFALLTPATFELPQGAAWLAVLAAYLLGAVPFGLVVARAKGIDLRTVGSGNIGATNAMRALGKPLGIAVFLLDVAKGALPVLLCWRPFELQGDARLSLQLLCGTAAVLGHCFPVYLRFKGGKGVATGCGALIALDYVVFLGGGAVWLATFYGLRYVGLASITMGLSFPLIAWWRGHAVQLIVATALLTLLIVVRHRSNIARMLAGTEPKAGAKKTESAHVASGGAGGRR